MRLNLSLLLTVEVFNKALHTKVIPSSECFQQQASNKGSLVVSSGISQITAAHHTRRVHIQRCKLTLMSNHGWSLAREPLRRRGDALFLPATWCRDQDSSLAVPNSSSAAAWSRPCAHVTILEFPVSNLCLCLT